MHVRVFQHAKLLCVSTLLCIVLCHAHDLHEFNKHLRRMGGGKCRGLKGTCNCHCNLNQPTNQPHHINQPANLPVVSRNRAADALFAPLHENTHSAAQHT